MGGPKSRLRGLKVGSRAIQSELARKSACTKCTVPFVRKTPSRLSSPNCTLCDFQRIDKTSSGSSDVSASTLRAGRCKAFRAPICDDKLAFHAVQKCTVVGDARL